ncbi:MAG: glycosyltransferase [Bryobacteraceae bacterium]
MTRLMVYSHDTFGLGNIRRMLALSQHLIEHRDDLSILLVTGSPVIHSLRLPKRLDYIKLPCLTRTGSETYSAKTLGTTIDQTLRLRSQLILAATAEFRPDIMLIDKKPGGIKNELDQSLAYARRKNRSLKTALILRDILDEPSRTIAAWERQGQYDRVATHYDIVLVMGERSIFDQTEEYRFPPAVAAKTVHCGYLGRSPREQDSARIRAGLGVKTNAPMVLVTAGGGEDGFPVLESYANCLNDSRLAGVQSVVVTGPEMPNAQRERLTAAFAAHPNVHVLPFAEDLFSIMKAADAVVSMGGYNTVCELLSLRKRAVVIPRAEPVAEQWIRTQRLADRGLFSTIHPSALTPATLCDAVVRELKYVRSGRGGFYPDMNALDRIADWTASQIDVENGLFTALRPLRTTLLPCL